MSRGIGANDGPNGGEAMWGSFLPMIEPIRHTLEGMCSKLFSVGSRATTYWVRAFTFVLVLLVPIVAALTYAQVAGERMYTYLGGSDEICRLNRLLRALIAQLLSALSKLYCPSDIIIHGDHEILKKTDTYIICSNHQIYTDWLTIWCLTQHWDAAHNVVIILKREVFKLPLIGTLIRLIGFIGISRKWCNDEVIIRDSTSNLVKSKYPTWLLMFPEGTVITEETYTLYSEYAKRNHLHRRFKNVLLPRSRGMSACISNLKPKISGVVDLTIVYGGVPPGCRPYDYYSIQGMFFGGRYPKKIHVYIKYHPIASIPGKWTSPLLSKNQDLDVEFAKWMEELFSEKDRAIDKFHKTGYFETPGEGVTINPPRASIMFLAFFWIISVVLHTIVISMVFIPFRRFSLV